MECRSEYGDGWLVGLEDGVNLVVECAVRV